MAIEIKFLANLVSFIRGTRDMSTHLDDVVDSIADVVEEAEQAERAGEDIGDGVAKGAREAESATDRLRRGFREVQEESRRTSRQSRDDFDRMGENTSEFKNEAVQNFSEVASSFSGDMTEMADGVQGLTGGLASALTPGIGIPVAILGAAAGAFLASWQQAAEDSETRVSDMFTAMLESGARFATESYIQEAMTALADDTGKWNEALQRSESSGLEVSTILRAMVGDAEAIGLVYDAEKQKLADRLDLVNRTGTSEEEKNQGIILANQLYADSTGWLKQIQEDTGTAAAKATAVASAFEDANAQVQKVRDKVAGVVRDMDRVGKGVTVPIRADTTGLDGVLARYQGRTIQVNVHGQITKIGQNVW